MINDPWLDAVVTGLRVAFSVTIWVIGALP
jgi:hypothetical protein